MFLVACKQKHIPNPDNCMAFDDVKFVSEFPETVSLAGSIVDMDVIGMLDIAIYDTMMVVSSNDKNGYLDFLSLPDMNHHGKFLKGGRGPNEMLNMPWISSAVPLNDGDNLKIVIFDNNRDSYFIVDIGETIKTSELNMVLIADSLPGMLTSSSCIYIDDTTLFCNEAQLPGINQIRYVLRNGIKDTPVNFEKLNSAFMPVNLGYTALASITRYDRQNGLIVEIPILLNHINLYSVDGEFGKSICLDRQIDDIDELANDPYFSEREIFANPRIYSDYFGVLYLNHTNRIMELGRGNKPAILMFDWKGEPLMKLELDRYATSFDIDFVNRYLYTLDRETEEMSVYYIKDVLEELEN